MTVDDAATARPDLKRRAFLGAVGTTAAGLAASTPAAAQEGSSGSGSGSGNGGTTDGTIEKAWFEGVGNYDGVVDETGKEAVTVAVGAQGNGGSFAFEPAALRVDPGTTVRWEWTGEGGGHNVVSESGAFESEIASDARFTFEHAFEEPGATRYVCVPHQSMGMRGAVLVGPDAAVGGSAGESDEGKSSPYGGWLDNTDNFEKVLDRTDQDRVEVLVGAQGNGGSFAFSPPAIEIERGTTVVWRWAEDAGALDLAATDGSFWTDFGREAGETFEWTSPTTRSSSTPRVLRGAGNERADRRRRSERTNARRTAIDARRAGSRRRAGDGVALADRLRDLPVRHAKHRPVGPTHATT